MLIKINVVILYKNFDVLNQNRPQSHVNIQKYIDTQIYTKGETILAFFLD